MITLLYNLADTYFVGMLDAPHETAAITVVYPSFLMLTAISNLFGVGGASAIARALGTKDEEGARRISAISIWGGILCALLFSCIFFCLEEPVLRLCGATADTYEIARGYAAWVVILGGPFTILNTLLANLVRAEGGASQAAFGVSFGGVLNLVFWIRCSSCRSSCTRGLSGPVQRPPSPTPPATVYFLVYLSRRKGSTYLNLSPANLKFLSQYWRPILDNRVSIRFAVCPDCCSHSGAGKVRITVSDRSRRRPLGSSKNLISSRYTSPLAFPMGFCLCLPIITPQATMTAGKRRFIWAAWCRWRSLCFA